MSDLLEKNSHETEPLGAPVLTLEAVRQDYRLLDSGTFPTRGGVRLLSTTFFKHRVGLWTDVDWVSPGRILDSLRFFPVLRDGLHAVKILTRADERSVILCDGGSRVSQLTCLLNSFIWTRRRRIVMWESFISGKSKITRFLIRRMIQGCRVIVVYSRILTHIQSQYTKAPLSNFIFIPYKADHSKTPPLDIHIDNYIFSGGNSERDYGTLFEAVRGTDIPVIVSATDPAVTRSLDVPANVLLLAAEEPAFARLMAGSRFVVVTTRGSLTHGAAETTACNAMWHGKPVIAANDTSLMEHIKEGITGHVVPAGDIAGLRSRILALWNDPERISLMGHQAHEWVKSNLTHEHFMRRLNRLATLVAIQEDEPPSSVESRE